MEENQLQSSTDKDFFDHQMQKGNGKFCWIVSLKLQKNWIKYEQPVKSSVQPMENSNLLNVNENQSSICKHINFRL